MNNYKNIAKIKAIDKKNEQKLLAVNPRLDNQSGIYFLLRKDSETGIKFSYVGQARHIKDRLLQHLRGFQRIDISLKSHKLYSKDNPDGWDIQFIHYPIEKLDEMERYYITLYAKNGYQSRNIDTGGGAGKRELGERKQPKTYREGVERGYINASKEVANLFDKHLNYSKKSDKPNKNQDRAAEKFEDFLNYYKTTEEIEVEKYGRTVVSGGSK